MRVAVIGAGAMGSIFGARLAQAGHDTTFVDVNRRLIEHIARSGVTVTTDGAERTTRTDATTDAADVGVVDLVLLFVKCYHTAAAIEGALRLIGPDTTVLSLQNGWGNGGTISRVVGDDRLLVGVTYASGTVLDVARVAHTGAGVTSIGPYADASSDRVARIAAALRDAGFEVEQPANITTEIWRKLILNAATLPTAALTGLTAGSLGEPGPMLDLVEVTAREAVAVASSRGLDIDADERIDRINAVLNGAGSGKGSMLQDLEAGRRTEVDVITGAVLRSADDAGLAVPINRALYALIRGYERAHGLHP